MTDGSTKTFEEKLQGVQEIVSRIEEGKLPLEDSVKQYEEGMKTLEGLEKELKDMTRRLTVLQDGKETELRTAEGTNEDA